MKRSHKLTIGAVLALSVVAVGGAIGATQLTPSQESQAVIDDAADQLGVEPSELSGALKQALKNRVDAAVEDGRVTKQQAERMKERIDAGGLPLFGMGPRGLHDHGRKGFPPMLFGGKLEGASEYLGVNRRELFDSLAAGKTLADVARERGKPVDGLVTAMVEGAEKRLDEAVAAGKLTAAEKNEALVGLKERITRLVNDGFRARRVERHRAYFIPPTF
jgi:outer membrane murein-binding lipoprotein Lpp